MIALEKFMHDHTDWLERLLDPPYNLMVARDGNYVLLRYTQGVSDSSYREVREARGSIFDVSGDHPVCVCHPFDRFFNYGDPNAADIDWEHVTVQEKIDGSLMKVWWHNGWHISTNGMIDAAKASVNSVHYDNFRQLFEEGIKNGYEKKGHEWTFATVEEFFDRYCCKGVTYMFELVSPYTRVVIPYPETLVYFLGARSIETHKEFDRALFRLDGILPSPKLYLLFSYESVAAAAEELPWDEEGYVVCDYDFNRVKIKSPEYVKAHYTRANNNITVESLVDVIRQKEQEEFLIYASDYVKDLEAVENALESWKRKCIDLFNEYKPNCPTKKDFALAIKDVPGYAAAVLFVAYDLNDPEKAFDQVTERFTAKKIAEILDNFLNL